MRETVSAMIDGELSDHACGNCSDAVKADAGLREAWDTYALIGDALRGTPATGFQRSFADRLAAEPTVLAPGRTSARRARRNGLYALSAAAGVAAVSLVAWMTLPSFQAGPSLDLAKNSSPPVATADARPGQAVVPVAHGAEDYLLAHQRVSPSFAMHGVAPYVRMVSDDRSSAAR